MTPTIMDMIMVFMFRVGRLAETIQVIGKGES